MKNTILFSFLVLGLNLVNAQNIYTINTDMPWSNNGVNSFPNPCYNCTFNLADGVTLTIDKDVKLQNVRFNGGTIIVNGRELTLNTNNSTGAYFKDLRLILNGKASVIANTEITIQNSSFILNNTSFIKFNSFARFESSDMKFNANSYFIFNQGSDLRNTNFALNDASEITFNSSTTLTNSKLKFNDNSNMIAQSGDFIMKDKSNIIIGDGSTTSKAYAKFNGAALKLYDVSFVSVSNLNNYYFNWSTYRSMVNNISYNTTNNNINCDPRGTNTGKNQCEAPKLFGPSMIDYTGISMAAALPVTMSGFSVSISKSGMATITWSTKQESNSAFFEVQRSNDGSNWKKAGTVKANGNSTINISYSYSDNQPVSGVVYYRLKMVDADGSFVYSSIKVAEISLSSSISVFPNPATDYVNISLKGNQKTAVNVQIINQFGQTIDQQLAQEGKTMISIDVKNYIPGMYMIRIAGENGKSETHRFIVKRS